MRHLIHKAICWYLRRCAGAFHCYNYGAAGRYVVLMNDDQYHVHQKTERVVRAILIAHGSYGDGSNLDKLTRAKCLELLQPLDRRSNACVKWINRKSKASNMLEGEGIEDFCARWVRDASNRKH